MANLFKLESPFKPSGAQPRAIAELIENTNAGLARQTLLGVTGSGKTFTIANLIQATQRPTMIMAPNKTLAAQFYAEMRDFFPHNSVEYFVSYYDYYQPEAYVPASGIFIEKDASINAQIEQMRLSATKALLEREDSIVVSSVSAIYGLGDPQAYLAMVLHIVRGDRIDQRELLHKLANLQYTRNEMAFERGTYRVQGEIIDIFPAESEKHAVRISLFDDEIETISIFDPLTQKIYKKVPRFTIFPKSHYVTPKQKIIDAAGSIREELDLRLEELHSLGKLVEEQRLRERTNLDLELMVELGHCSGIENYSRYLSGRGHGEPPPTLMDYLPDNALLVIDESHVTIPQIGAMYKGDRARKQNLVEYGFRLPSALDNRPLRFDEFEDLMPQLIMVSATPGNYEEEKQDAVVELLVRPTGLIDPEIEIRPVATQVDDVMSEVNIRAKKNERVLITTLTKKMSEDLTEYFTEHGLRVRYLHSDIETVERVEIIRDLRLGVFDALIGINLLREGLDIPEVSLVAILDADKEGFLRSRRSLIQTIGRAARNVEGRAILYADRITDSMKIAIDETDRRREIQKAYNIEHGITPTSIKKKIRDILETEERVKQDQLSVCENDEDGLLNPKEAAKRIKQLDKQMLKYAKDMEFEKAAAARDRIQTIKMKVFGGKEDSL